MPYGLFEQLVRQVRAPRKFLLNYSGESTVYPDLIAAIRLARSTGAAVELVSALASAPDTLVRQLATAGLTRLTVSLHAAEPGRFNQIYRHGSLAALESRLELLSGLCGSLPDSPEIDLAFVGMQQNLDQLPGVARLAHRLAIGAISIFPIIRRDPIPVQFPSELTGNGQHRPEFREQLNRQVDDCRERFPEIRFTISNPEFTTPAGQPGACPGACPGGLPAGAQIYSCEQNPWETAHVLSNGDVVACEVHDREPLGNLARQSLREIWHGEPYHRFRSQYRSGELPACRSCPWKSAWLPGPLEHEILAERGRSSQLGWGWHDAEGERHMWASQQAVASLGPRSHSSRLHVRGILPPGPAGHANQLAIGCNGTPAGVVENPSGEMMAFDVEFPLPDGMAGPWEIGFETRFLYRPRDRGAGPDSRDLGFALLSLAAREGVNPTRVREQRSRVGRLMEAIGKVDWLGRALASGVRHRYAAGRGRPLRPGMSVVIPERNNPAELAACLAGLRAAARGWMEPLQTVVVVNGAPAESYRPLRQQYAEVEWEFHAMPMGFAPAVTRGLRRARFDWIYLLNSDVVLEEAALTEAGSHRDPMVFSIASQILLKDVTRFRDETNWTRLFIDGGLVATHDLIPRSSATVEHFYAGGGASLFQTHLLRRVVDGSAYHPFYWEDVEWGWRARKLGYRSLFCGTSLAHHTHRATISRHYSADEIEAVVARNRLLFQLRNFLTVGSLEAVAEAIGSATPEVAGYFTGWHALGEVARGRLWNHRAPVPDEEVLRG